jgi:hypothetical protein
MNFEKDFLIRVVLDIDKMHGINHYSYNFLYNKYDEVNLPQMILNRFQHYNIYDHEKIMQKYGWLKRLL